MRNFIINIASNAMKLSTTNIDHKLRLVQHKEIVNTKGENDDTTSSH